MLVSMNGSLYGWIPLSLHGLIMCSWIEQNSSHDVYNTFYGTIITLTKRVGILTKVRENQEFFWWFRHNCEIFFGVDLFLGILLNRKTFTLFFFYFIYACRRYTLSPTF